MMRMTRTIAPGMYMWSPSLGQTSRRKRRLRADGYAGSAPLLTRDERSARVLLRTAEAVGVRERVERLLVESRAGREMAFLVRDITRPHVDVRAPRRHRHLRAERGQRRDHKAVGVLLPPRPQGIHVLLGHASAVLDDNPTVLEVVHEPELLHGLVVEVERRGNGEVWPARRRERAVPEALRQLVQ